MGLIKGNRIRLAEHTELQKKEDTPVCESGATIEETENHLFWMMERIRQLNEDILKGETAKKEKIEVKKNALQLMNKYMTENGRIDSK